MNQSNQPLVSVVIPCYNHENFVQDSIQSVIDQTYQNIELIIIDDGSKDGSVDKIQEMIPACQERFTRFEFRSRPNKGLSTTLNEALEWCQGEYYSVIASDDMMMAHKIKAQVDYLLKNRNCIAVFGGYILVDNDNNFITQKVDNFKCYNFEEIFLHKHNLPAPTQMIQMEALRNTGGYRADIIIEDWYMWLKLSNYGELHYLDYIFSNYRTHPENTSKKIEIMHTGRLQIIDSYINHAQYSKAKREVYWIYINELRRSKEIKSIITYVKFIISNPLFFIYKLGVKVFK